MTRDCIEWKGRTDKDGYGTIGSRRAHRVAWEQTFGPIPDGLQVLHKCDNPPCCNPDHLFLGTRTDNMNDKVRKGRQHRKQYRHRHKGDRVTIPSQIELSPKRRDPGKTNQSLQRVSYSLGTMPRDFILR
jgi:hypothetical protein